MGISRVGSANSYIYDNMNKNNNRRKGTVLFDHVGMNATSNPHGCQGSRISTNDAYNSMKVHGKFRSEIGEHYLQSFNAYDRSVNLLVQSNGEVQRVENERYVIDVSDEIEGNWCIYDKKSNESFALYPMSTSIQTDENTGKDYIVTCYPWGGLRNVMYADDALIEGIKTFLHADDITKSVLNDKYSIEAHSYTGIECLKVKGQEGNGSWLMMSGEQQQLDRLQELADLYQEKYPNIVNDDGLALKFYAEGEATGHVVRTGNGIMIVACNGISYIDNNDPSKSWGFMFSENDTDIYNEIMRAIIEGSIKGGIESVSGWEAWFQGKGYIYERIFSDEELAVMANGKDVKYDADFIAGSDRGKALAVTMNADSMRSTISVEVFDPV